MKIVYLNKKKLLIFAILAAVYFLLRLPNLTLQPIFADEAIYIRWAQVMRAEPSLRFLPQSDGKTPLFMWVMIPLFKVFSDPLFAGRFLSVISGFFTMLGVFFLAKKVFNLRTAYWSAIIYVILPYTVFFDRMALVDSMLSAFTIWVIYFAILLSEKNRLDLAMILGYLLGGTVLTKTPGMVNFLMLPLSILTFNKSKNSLLKLLLFWLVAIIIGFAMYNFLRLGPQFHLLSSRNQDYIFSPVELLERPLDPFIPHFRDMADWFPKLFTPVVLIFIALGIFSSIKEINRKAMVLLFWTIIPMLISMAFLKTFTARYLLTSVAPLLIFAAWGIEKISNFKLIFSYIFLIIALLPIITFNYQLLVEPPPDSLPKEERKGYFEEWTAGYGLSKIANFLIEEKKKGRVVVGTEGSFGTLPDGLFIYLDKADIAIVGGGATISAELRDTAKRQTTFFVGNKNRVGGLDKIEKILEFPKTRPVDGTKRDSTILYRVLP